MVFPAAIYYFLFVCLYCVVLVAFFILYVNNRIATVSGVELLVFSLLLLFPASKWQFTINIKDYIDDDDDDDNDGDYDKHKRALQIDSKLLCYFLMKLDTIRKPKGQRVSSCTRSTHLTCFTDILLRLNWNFTYYMPEIYIQFDQLLHTQLKIRIIFHFNQLSPGFSVDLPSIHPSIHPPTHLSTEPPTHPSIQPSIQSNRTSLPRD